MTVEEAQEQILGLKDTLQENNLEIENLKQEVENSTTLIKEKNEEIEKLKEYNMKLFLRVTTEEKENNNILNEEIINTKEKTEVKSWEDFKLVY